MACGDADREGYKDERFQTTVSRSLYCVVCCNVFKDPVMCQHNEHYFCRPCITRHLIHSQTCPTCKDQLSLETLKPVPQILTSLLSDLNIRCNYFDRGCPEFIPLEDLQNHVTNCGFSPVICSNEGCFVEINKQDQIHHESEVCEFRKVKCHECTKVRKDLMSMAQTIDRMGTKIDMIFDAVNNKVENNQAPLRDEINEIKRNQRALYNIIETISIDVESSNNETRKIELEQAAVIDDVKVVKLNQSTLNKEIKEMKRQDAVTNGKIKIDLTEIKNQLAMLTGYMLQKQTTQTASDLLFNIIIVGGDGSQPGKSAERFCSTNNAWMPLQPTKNGRIGSSSFVFKNQMIVSGGSTKNMESFKIDSAKDINSWSSFPAELPTRLSGHTSLVFNEHLIVVGGLADGVSDKIVQIALARPYTVKHLSSLKSKRWLHGAELISNSNILICGGTTSGLTRDCVNTVVLYDIVRDKWKGLAPLPYAVCDMATVTCGDNVIVIGGAGSNSEALNSVVSYNVKTGNSHMLPGMKSKRRGCAAVIVGNKIVVMGGDDGDDNNYLKSVEMFNFSSYSWEDLSPMNESRYWATAIAW